jgi:hypothetical protein
VTEPKIIRLFRNCESRHEQKNIKINFLGGIIMAQFKKLATLCMSLLMTASFVGCADLLNGLLPEKNSESSEVSSEETSEETSEDLGTSEELEEETPIYLGRGDTTVSVAAGETVDLQLAIPGLILGAELGLTWTSENAKVIVNDEVVEGTYATLVITPMFTLALSTVNGEAEDIVLTIGEAQQEASPVVTLGETTVEVSAEQAGWGVEYTFTAEETAMYTLATEDENCSVSWSNPAKSGYIYFGESNEFGLEAGEMITLYVGTANYEAGTVTFTLTKGGAYNPYALVVGANNLKVTEADGANGVEYTFVATEAGNYTLNSWSSADPATGTVEEPILSAISYTINGETKYVNDTETLLTVKAGDVITFTAYAYHEYAYMEGVCMIDLNITPVNLAGEEATVEIVDGEGEISFFVTEAGTYNITITEGAQVMDLSMETWEWVEITSITAEANSIVTLTVKSETLTEATITITKA